MKKIILASLFALSALAVATAQDPRLISVSGSAEASQEPDMARVQVNVWGKADSAKTAQGLANQENEHFKKVISSFNLQKQDISTTGYDLTPEYKWEEKTNSNKIIGYTANQSIRVTLKKAEQVGKFLDALIKEEKTNKSGIMVQGVAWDLEKREEMERNLLTAAVKNAEETAQILAKAARVKIKNVYRLTPQSFNTPIPMFAAAPMMKSMDGGARETTVFSGEIKVRAQVTADFEIE